jgi:16S rRNA (cytosine967-C5)-methyltransferase
MNSFVPFRDPRRLAVWAVDRVFRSGAYAELLLDHALDRSGLASNDRALATELVYGTLRWWKKLNWILERVYHGDWHTVPEMVRRVLEVGLYQVLFLEKVPAYAAVDEAVHIAAETAGRRWTGPVNAVLRTLIRDPALAVVPDMPDRPAFRMSIEWSHPLWLVEVWFRAYGGERAESICRANNMRPGVGIRINPLRDKLESVAAELRSGGTAFEPCLFAPGFLVLIKSRRVEAFPGFQEGRFSVQDPSAGLVAPLVDPHPGEKIYDMAAAPGGKAAHMAENSGDRAFVLAADVHPARIRLVVQNLKRLGLHSIAPVVADGCAGFPSRFDKVLVDAPCSGLGVIRRRPELRWRRQPEDVQRLAAKQARMLDAAAGSVKPGGIVVYSTCTVLDEENQAVVSGFLERHRDFTIQHAAEFVSGDVVSEKGFVETWPDRHGVDGSFAARLKRTG